MPFYYYMIHKILFKRLSGIHYKDNIPSPTSVELVSLETIFNDTVLFRVKRPAINRPRNIFLQEQFYTEYEVVNMITVMDNPRSSYTTCLQNNIFICVLYQTG